MSVQPYILPASTTALPNSLTLTQFVQAVLTGISGLKGNMVRPKWQKEPPKNPPDIETNWIAFGINLSTPDANAYIGVDPDNDAISISQRHEQLDVGLSLYGPNAFDNYGVIRDGFQVPQNRQALNAANMAFVEITAGLTLPELVNERYYNRIETIVVLRRQIIRTYGVPSLVSAEGIIYVPLTGDADYSLAWETPEES